MIYEAVAAHQDLTPYVSGVLAAFGVPPLGDTDLGTLDSRFASSLPLVFVPQVSEIADAFADGGMLSVDSFIAAANERGARQKGTGLPLTRDYLSQSFAPHLGKVQYEEGQVLPAFLVALAQARASQLAPAGPGLTWGGAAVGTLPSTLNRHVRHAFAVAQSAVRAKRLSAPAVDPIWGDGLLDPLQVTLMLYAISYASAGPLPVPAAPTTITAPADTEPARVGAGAITVQTSGENPLTGFVKDQIRDKVTDEFQDFVEIPLDKEEAVQVSVCASLLLYGHKLKVTTTPDLIYHLQTDGTVPSATRVDTVLTFEDDYWDNYLPSDRWLLQNLGNCTLPRRGTVPGKPLEWSVSDGLSDHGSFDLASPTTNEDGEGIATWRTVTETTPASRRTFDNQRDAVGSVIVRAGSLVPGWSTLERVVGALKDTGNTGDSPLTVIYYVDPCTSGSSPSNALSGPRLTAGDPAVCADTWTGTFAYTNAYNDGTTRQNVVWSGTVTWGHVVLPSSWERDYGVDSGTSTITVDGATPGCTFHGERAMPIETWFLSGSTLTLFADGSYYAHLGASALVTVHYSCPPPGKDWDAPMQVGAGWGTASATADLPHLINGLMQGIYETDTPPFAESFTWSFTPGP